MRATLRPAPGGVNGCITIGGMRLGVLLAGAVLAVPASAHADETITAEVVWRFGASSYTIDQGEALSFANNDSLSPGPHDVTATAQGPDGKPLFASETVPAGQTVPVAGARELKAGSYPFLCTVHRFMTATLVVAGADGPDTRAPAVAATIGKATLRSRRFPAAIVVDEPADLRLRMVARVRGRTVLVGTAAAKAEAERRTRVVIRASKKARRAFARAREARFTLAVEARDAADNVGTAIARSRISA
jgi:plastocyanin